jgi:hypothetical protein
MAPVTIYMFSWPGLHGGEATHRGTRSNEALMLGPWVADTQMDVLPRGLG